MGDLSPRVHGGVRRPFSLVETVCAVSVLVVVMAAVVGFLSFQVWQSDAITERMIANALAKNRIEELKSAQYADLLMFAEEETRLNDGGAPDPNGTFTRTTVIEGERYRTRVLTVTVTTRGKLNRPGMHVTATTIVRDRAMDGT
jgi:type II secretory pathway pseudopilin PulG